MHPWDTATGNRNKIVVEVQYAGDVWWRVCRQKFPDVYEQLSLSHTAEYSWRDKQNNEVRYMIDIKAMRQVNLQSSNVREVRVAEEW